MKIDNGIGNPAIHLSMASLNERLKYTSIELDYFCWKPLVDESYFLQASLRLLNAATWIYPVKLQQVASFVEFAVSALE